MLDFVGAVVSDRPLVSRNRMLLMWISLFAVVVLLVATRSVVVRGATTAR